ncbi:MAG: SDR family NAD(P)-dependent oxidoreductase [Caldisericaceae bacterium]
MNIELKGKTILITGGSSGIGRASLAKLLDGGAEVIAVGRDEKHIEDSLKAAPHVSFIKADLRDESSVDYIEREVSKLTDKIYGFVHAAGVIYCEPFETFRLHELQEMLRVNVESGFRLLQKILPLLKRGGSAVFISSIDAYFAGDAPSSGYALSKSALIGLTNALAKEFGTRGIRINTIIPGLIRTPMTEDFFTNEFKERRKHFLERVPLGRAGTPEEVANLLMFLLSDASSYISGDSIFIDGGYHTT